MIKRNPISTTTRDVLIGVAALGAIAAIFYAAKSSSTSTSTAPVPVSTPAPTPITPIFGAGGSSAGRP